MLDGGATQRVTGLSGPLFLERSMSLRELLLMRFIPKDIDGLRTIVNDERLPDEMKVEADEDTGVAEKTVGELCARSTWPRGLVVITPRQPHPEAAVKISVAN